MGTSVPWCTLVITSIEKNKKKEKEKEAKLEEVHIQA
jgi:hypothetical protein